MKKGIWSTMAVMVLLLLTACGQTDKNSNTFEDEKTPTPIEVPTSAPIAEISQVPNLQPTVEPTIVPSVTQTITPVLEPSIEPTATESPTPTATLIPSAEPTASATPSPEPSLEPTESLTPTIALVPSAAPTASATPKPEPSIEPTATEPPTPTAVPSLIPTPTINPNPLITNGWQKMISVDEKYKIIFPELYKESVVTRTDKELEISYSCVENKDIALTIGYTMQQKREYFVYEILSVSGSIIEERPEEKRTTCVWQLENQKHLAIFIDEEYSRDLLGPVFGEEEWIPGVMYVAFSYPADKCDIYETEQYCFYIVNNGEE